MMNEPIDILISLFVWALLFAFIRYAWNQDKLRRRPPDPVDPVRPLDIGKFCREPTNYQREKRWLLKDGNELNLQEKLIGEPLLCVKCGRQSPVCECLLLAGIAAVRYKPGVAAFSGNENTDTYTEPVSKEGTLHLRNTTLFPITQAERDRLRNRRRRTKNHGEKTDTG